MKRFILSSVLLVACSGSSSDVPSKQSDTSPTSPSGSSGGSSSGGASSTSSSSSGSSAPATSDAGVPATNDAGSDAASNANCVPKGYAGNEKKIGAYCDDDVSCPFSIDPFLVCTKPYDPTGNHMFCTAGCSNDAECGSGAYCVKDPQGNGCVPTQCGGAPSQ